MQTKHEAFMKAIEGNYDRSHVIYQLGKYIAQTMVPQPDYLELRPTDSFEHHGVTNEQKKWIITELSQACLGSLILYDEKRVDEIQTLEEAHAYIVSNAPNNSIPAQKKIIAA